ncbi:hypothetical protein GOV13_02180 [Candidatus Pacearchaeota archaeon]|nr:hypothetical protein [Candidatus Pacearchaeota archaeon]
MALLSHLNIKMKNKLTITLITFLVLSLFLAQNVIAADETIYFGDYQLNYSYSGAEEGERFTLTVTILNEDSSARNDIVFGLEQDDPFDIDREDRDWDIGTLGSGESASSTFRIEVDEDTNEGKYNLEFTLEDDDDDYDDDIEIEIDSDKANLIIGGVNSIPTTISPDQEDVKLTINLNNIGGGNATFVRAKLELPKDFVPSTSFSDVINIGTIGAGEDSEAVFYIDTGKDLESGIHNGKLVLEFKTDGNEEKSTLDFEIPVKGAPLFSILSSSTNPSKIVQGGLGQVSIKIQNIGEEEGKETSVRIFENSDQPFNFEEKTNFVGTLKKGETGTATFKFDVDDNANLNSYIVKVQVRTLNKGNVMVSEHTVSIRVNEAENGIFSNKLVLAGGFIIIFGGGFWVRRVWKKRRD